MKEQMLTVINKLPHSKTRVPYTYHHDYIRWALGAEISRSQIASLSQWEENGLYSAALTQIIEECSAFTILQVDLTTIEKEICWKAKEIAEDQVKIAEQLLKQPSEQS